MMATTSVNPLFSFKTSGQPEMELLAFSLEVRKLLKSNGNYIGYIPKSVFQVVPTTVFQELIFDTLSPMSGALDDRLTLEVRNSDFFEIASRF